MMFDTRVSSVKGGKQKRRKGRKTAPSVYDIQPAEKSYIPVDLASYLVEKGKEVKHVDVQTQTDTFEPRPPTPPYIARKTGIDVATQIEESDIAQGFVFDFDLEVEPILQIIMGKTIEQAQMEVEEEEELKSIQSRREELDVGNHEKRSRVRELEAKEIQIWEKKQVKLREERDRVRREVVVTDKVSSVQFVAELLRGMDEHVTDWMDTEGYLKTDDRESIEMDFMPWVMHCVEEKLESEASAATMVDEVLVASLVTRYAQFDKRKCWIRVMVKGAPGTEPEPVGPIPVYPKDTVKTVLENIQAWMTKHQLQSGGEQKVRKKKTNRFKSSKKEQPTLTLVYDSSELSGRVKLLTVAKDLRLLEVRTPEYIAASKEGSEDDDDDEDEDGGGGGGGRRRGRRARN